MQELFVDKIYFFKFLSMSDKPQLQQLKIITSIPSTVQASLTAWLFPSVPGKAIKEGEIPNWNTKPDQLIKHAKISYSIVSLLFLKFSCGPYQNGFSRGTSKLRYSKYLKKYEPC